MKEFYENSDMSQTTEQ